MRSFDQSSSSPVLVLPAQHPQPSFNMDSNRPTFTAPFNNGSNGIQQSPATSSWSSLTPTTQSPPRPAASRKRSRDESNLEEDYFPVAAPIAPPEPENEDDWEYGEGMTIIKKKGKEYVADSTSQTQDWAEEKAMEERAKAAAMAAAAAAAERPVIRATKSQRLNLSSTPAIPEERSSSLATASPGSPERHTEPTVDDFTRHLGIGWSSINNAGPDIQAAARGWAKFVENHFPITNAKIQLTSKSLESYLVEANEGYFLFGEDLRQGRLVSTSLEKTWMNLRGPVPIFDGDLVMEAGQTPKIEPVQPTINEDNVMNGVQVQLAVNGDSPTNGLQVVGVANGINPPIANKAHVMEAAANGSVAVSINDANTASVQTIGDEMDMS